MMFWFSYTVLHGRLVIMDVTEERRHGVRCFTAAWSEDPRVSFTDFTAALALAKLAAHLEAALTPSPLCVTFLPQPVHASA